MSTPNGHTPSEPLAPENYQQILWERVQWPFASERADWNAQSRQGHFNALRWWIDREAEA